MLDSPATQGLGAALSIVAGAGAIALGVLFRRKSAATSSWFPVSAKILSSRVVSDDGGVTPSVSYRYSVDGRDFESSCIRLICTSSSLKRAALTVVERYPVSSQAIAYVNPDDHREAVLEPGTHPFGTLLFYVTGVGLLAIGVYRYLVILGLVD